MHQSKTNQYFKRVGEKLQKMLRTTKICRPITLKARLFTKCNGTCLFFMHLLFLLLLILYPIVHPPRSCPESVMNCVTKLPIKSCSTVVQCIQCSIVYKLQCIVYSDAVQYIQCSVDYTTALYRVEESVANWECPVTLLNRAAAMYPGST